MSSRAATAKSPKRRRPSRATAATSPAPAPRAAGVGPRLARFLAIALVALPPILVLPGLREAYRLPKLAASELLALASLCALSLGLFYVRRFDLRAIARSPPVIATAPLVVGVALSALFTDHREHALAASWSFAVALAALVGFALAMPRLRTLLDWLFVPATILAGIALLERFGLFDPLPVTFDESSRYAAVSLAGNIGDLASYLVLPLLLAQARLLAAARRVLAPDRDGAGEAPETAAPFPRRARWLDVAWLAGALVWLGALAVGQVLTAVAALAGGSAVFWWCSLEPRRRLRSAALLAAVAIVAILATPLRTRVVEEWSQLRDRGDLNVLLTGRLDGWRTGIWIGEQHPLLGAGPGAYAAEFAPAKLALLDEGVRFFRGHGPMAAFRNAHNEPIEIFAELGVLGVLASAWLVLFVVRGAWTAPSRDDRALGLAAIAALAVLGLAHFPLRSALVGYPYVVAGAWLLSLAPSFTLRSRRAEDADAAASPRSADPESSASRTQRTGPAAGVDGRVLGVLALAALLVFTVAIARRDLARLRANRVLWVTETQAAQIAAGGTAQRTLLARNIAGLERAYEAWPSDSRILHAIGSYYALLGRLGEAESEYRRALELDPRAETYLNLARVLERRDRRDEAAELYRTAVRLTPVLRAEVPEWVGDVARAARGADRGREGRGE